MSLSEISTRVAFVAGLALIALLVIGWRKTAKNFPTTPVGTIDIENDHHPKDQHPDVEFLSSSDVGRLAAGKATRVLSLGGIAVLLGIIVALTLSMSLAWMVTNILDRL